MKPISVQISMQAVRDLNEFSRHIGNSSPAAGRHFVEKAQKLAKDLVHFPESGSLVNEAQRELPGMRKKPIPSFANYLLYYVIEQEGITVARILHGARDQLRLLIKDQWS